MWYVAGTIWWPRGLAQAEKLNVTDLTRLELEALAVHQEQEITICLLPGRYYPGLSKTGTTGTI